MDPSGLKKILVVDDEADWRDLHQMALENVGGFTLKLCDGGKMALKAAPAFKPDFMVLDVMIGDMTGMDLLKQLREVPSLQKTPAIFVTARAQAHESAEYKTHDVVEVITKPYDPMTFADQIREIYKKA